MNVLWVLSTMSKLKALGVILSVALAALAYCLYTPMPPEAEEPFQQMKFLARFKSTLGFVSVFYSFVMVLCIPMLCIVLQPPIFCKNGLKQIHLKRGSKRNILDSVALVYITVETITGTQQSGRLISESSFHFKYRSISLFFQISLLDMVGLNGMDTFRKLRSTKPVIDPNDTVTVR